ncbi:MAG: cation:proton antiporter [Candidatus Aenigmatarchaeota archaeon]
MIEITYILGIIFVSSAAVLLLFKKTSNPKIPAYIIAGVIGGLFIAEEGLLELLQWGVAFVVFLFGAKLEPGRLKHGINASVLSVGAHITGLGIGFFGIHYFTGFGMLDSIYISAALVFSSSLTGTELSEKYATVELLYGRLAEATDLIHDMLAVLLILLLSPVLFGVSMGYALAVGGGMLAVSLIFRKFLFPWLFDLCDSSEELMMLSGVSMLALMIYISEIAGISVVVGAFFAGIAFSYFPYNVELVESMESLKDFFAAIFFFSLGALLAFPNIASLGVAAMIILVTVMVKPLLTAFSLMYYGYDKRTAYRCGLTLDQVSEFVLIIVIQAYLVGMITDFVFQGIILATIVTMVTTAYTDSYSDKIYSWLSEILPVDTPGDIQRFHTQIDTHLEDHIIIVGYDVQGSRLGEYLLQKGVDFVVIEINPERLEEAEELENYIFKSAMEDESWEKANCKEADLIISTAPQKNISEKVLSLDTDARKVVRSNRFEDAAELLDQGVDYVIVPDLLASEQLVDYVEEAIYGDREMTKRMRKDLLGELKEDLEGLEEK